MTTNPAPAASVPTTPNRSPLRLPGRVALPVIVLCLLGIGVIRGFDIIRDSAIVNILTLVLSFNIFIALVCWFVLRSGFSRKIRHTGVGVCLGLIVLFFVFFKIERVSGELVPEFRPRFEFTSTFPFFRLTRRPDEKLEIPVAANPVDTKLDEATAYDYPGFLGPNRSASVDWPEVKLARDWRARPPREVWRQEIGAGWSAFATSGGLAFTLEQRGENELVTCYRVDTGEPVWSHGAKALHTTALGAVGPRSTPTVDRGLVFALGATGRLHCLKATTGDVVWQKDLFEMYGLTAAESEQDVAWGRSNSPLVVDDLVIVPGARSKSGKGAGLVAFKRETGEKAWEGGKEQVSYASPALGTLGGVKQVLIVNESSFSGHDLADGRELWKQEWLGHSNSDANTSQAHALPGDRVFISKGYASGAALFEVKQVGGGWSVEELWYQPTLMKTKFTNVAFFDGYVYGLSDSVLECIALEKGEPQWKKGRYRQGQLLRVNDLLIVQSEFKGVYLVAADPAGHQELGNIPALPSQTWNNPAIFCRTEAGTLHCYLLIRNAEYAACYELPLEK